MVRVNASFTDRMHLAPDWVLLGIPRDDGSVMLVASDQMTRASLEARLEGFDAMLRPFEFSPRQRYTLTAEMDGCVVVLGADYAEAIRKLFGHWQPRARERREVGPLTRELPVVTIHQDTEGGAG